MKTTVPIKTGKAFREQLGWTHFVMFGIDEAGMQHVVTHGKTEADAKECADFGNKLKRAAQWPKELCRDKPLDRICGNCTFCDGARGSIEWYYSCYLEQKPMSVKRDRRACKDFEPRGKE